MRPPKKSGSQEVLHPLTLVTAAAVDWSQRKAHREEAAAKSAAIRDGRKADQIMRGGKLRQYMGRLKRAVERGDEAKAPARLVIEHDALAHAGRRDGRDVSARQAASA